MLARVVFIWLALLQAGCVSHLVVSGGAVNPDQLEKIRTRLVALRGLAFKREVPVEVKSKAEMRRHFEADLERRYGDEKLKNTAQAYARLGLLPHGVDLKSLLVEFYDSQVVAFYDPEEKKLVLPESLSAGMMMNAIGFVSRRDVLGEMVLAHELTHALQDQHFSIGEKLRPSNDDDRSWALRALIEGDATLSGFGFVVGELDEKKLATIERLLEGSVAQARASLAHLPEAIVESMLFQYHGGAAFVSRVVRERGWAGVNALYAAPPLSSEQLLHPEKFFEALDPPTTVELPDLTPLLDRQWVEIERNTVGELMIRVLLKRFLPEDQARSAAAGWDGDQFVAFRRDREIGFIWALVWDSSKDAEEFLAGFSEVLEKKDSGPNSRNGYIERRGPVVLAVEGFRKFEAEQWIERLWEGIQLVEAAPLSSSGSSPGGTRLQESGL